MKRCRDEGHDVVLVSGALDFLMSASPNHLGATHVIANRLEIKDGFATGRLLRPVVAGPEKARLVREHAREHGHDLDECFAYSDSYSDVPMLSVVGHPAAVNPDGACAPRAHLRLARHLALTRRFIALAAMVACASGPDTPTHPTPDQQTKATALLTGPDWYRHAVFYEVNVRSFQDSNGDGIGDLAGSRRRLDYLKDLGVDALWLMPIFPTAFKDSGYDISDYRTSTPTTATWRRSTQCSSPRRTRARCASSWISCSTTRPTSTRGSRSRARARPNPKADWYVWSDTPSRAGHRLRHVTRRSFGDRRGRSSPRATSTTSIASTRSSRT